MQLVPVAILMIAGVTGNGSGKEANLEWATHYGKAKQSAQQVQRPLLIVLEDPAEPKAKFDDGKLASKAGQKELLENFMLVRVDVSTPYGKKVKKAFRADKLPYTAITDKSAQFITFRGAGEMKPSEWTAALSRHKAGKLAAGTVKPRTAFKPAVQSDAQVVQPYVGQPVQPSYQFSFPSFSSGST